jgi:hypothetical protein
MPWIISRQDGKYCVLKQTNGEVKKCYDKRREALMYLRALYANAGPEAKDKEKK